ncbi:MAG: acyloxyacyl hydrolase [Flavobacteriales bacterium]|nr:MAG: acyloxyacyl hydrolase [Flavobacteriales bacterium]
MKLVKRLVVFMLFFWFISKSFSQNTSPINYEIEYTAGKIVPNYTKIFPSTNIQQAFALSLGKTNNDSLGWSRYYNFPETGVSFFASNLGNNKIYGNQFSILPYIRYKVIHSRLPTYIKLSLGISYFTHHYDSVSNIENLSVGSAFTWGFQAMLYQTIVQKQHYDIKLVGGYSHHSNGHTQLPNFGLNSALFGVSFQWNKANLNHTTIQQTKNKKEVRKYFIHLREGLGFHELGATIAPIGGDKKLVTTTSISFGILFKNHLKWKTGFSYRFYQHYIDYINANRIESFQENATLSASNIYYFMGVEFLMNHVAIDIEGGLNLYKPFYEKFNEDFQKDKGLNHQLKKWFNSRMGLNYYLINTLKKPRNNVFIGAHINANFGQADFTEFSIGYSYVFN